MTRPARLLCPRFDTDAGATIPPRRKSSVLSLATVPEESEGFLEDDDVNSGHGDGEDSGSASSSYSSPRRSGQGEGSDPTGTANFRDVGHQDAVAGVKLTRNQNARDDDDALLEAAEADANAQAAARLARGGFTAHNAMEMEIASAPDSSAPYYHHQNFMHVHNGGGRNNSIPRRNSIGSSPSIGVPYTGMPSEFGAVGVPVLTAGDQALGALIQQLSDSREELSVVQTYASAKERECADKDKELSLLISEVDVLLAEKEKHLEHQSEIVTQKEQLISHLQHSVKARTTELEAVRADLASYRREISDLQAERNLLVFVGGTGNFVPLSRGSATVEVVPVDAAPALTARTVMCVAILTSFVG